MLTPCAPIRPADAVADSIVALEKDRWLKGLVKKTKHPKVRSGCLTCKQRRLKCDETKPTCQRCLKSGRECAGYTNTPRASPVREPTPGVEQRATTAQDDELLEHFIGEAVQQLAGFSLSFRQFCQSLAPQLANNYPAVRYALLSVAARSRAATFRWDPRRPRIDAIDYKSTSLVYYNNAIQHLTTASNRKMPSEVYLVCGLLFAAIEFWPHQDMAPAMHILTAFKLVLRGTAMLPEAVKEGMLPFLTHMGRKTIAFSDDVPNDLASQMRTFVWINIRPPCVPVTFVSLKEAWNRMETLLNYIGAFTHDDPAFTAASRRDAINFAAELQRALVKTVELLPNDQHHQHRKTQYRALLMHHRVLQIMLEAAQVTDEVIYDLFTADFSHILHECEALLPETQHGDQDTNPKKGPWHTSLGLLAPLFFVATRCRIPALRHRAIKALHGSRRREREWNSCIATMLARLVVHTEEKSRASSSPVGPQQLQSAQRPAAAAALPEAHRVRLEHVIFDRDAEQMRASYVNAATGEGGEGVLSWRVRDGIDDDFECVSLSRKRLRLSGYAGIMLVTPPIACQCGGDEAMARAGAGGAAVS